MRERELDHLFERFRARGDVKALGRVFDEAASELYRIAAHLTRDLHEAEDLVQSTFLAAIESRDSYDPTRHLLPWLVGILVRTAAHEHRRRSRPIEGERLARPPDVLPPEEAQSREFGEALNSVLARLPSLYREVLEKHLREGKSPPEIALETRRAPGTVRVQIHRGLEMLRKMLPAGLAGGAAAALAPRGLGAVRASVLRSAESVSASVPVEPGVASTLGRLGGIAVTTKTVLVPGAALLLATVAYMLAYRPEPPGPPEENSAVAAVTPGKTSVQEDASPGEPGPLGPLPRKGATRELLTRTDPVSTPMSGRLSGRVVDRDGAPIEGATIYLVDSSRSEVDLRTSPPPTRSDEEGRWSLPVYEDRTTDVGVAKAGYAPVLRLDVSLSSTAEMELDDLVLGLEAEISGRVTDLGGRPLVGVRIGAMPAEGPEPIRWSEVVKAEAPLVFLPGRTLLPKIEVVALTDAMGAYSLRGLVAGREYRVRPAGPRHLAPEAGGERSERRVVPPEAGVDFTLSSSCVLVVRVLDAASGAALGGAEVRLRGRRAGLRETWRRVPDGYAEPIRFDRELAAGPYDVEAQVRGYETASETVVLDPGEPAEISLHLRQSEPGSFGAIRVVAKDNTGSPIPAMCLAIWEVSSRGPLPVAEANSSRENWTSGVREIGSLPPGRYRVRVTSQSRDYAEVRAPAEIRPGETACLEVVVPRTGRLRVEVTDSRGESLQGYAVEIRDEAGEPVEAELMVRSGLSTTQAVSQGAPIPYPGSLRIGRIPEGRHTLTISREGYAPKSEVVEVRAGKERTIAVQLVPGS